MSLFLCQSFITNINITPAREIPPATSGKAECPILSSFYQYGAAAWETLVRCVGPCRRTQAQVGSFRPIQVSWEGAAGHLGPDLLHPPALRTSCEGSGRMSSTGGGCDLQNFLLCCLDLFFFSFLSQVLTMQPSIPARQGGQAGRWVCRAAGEGGLWQLVQQQLASRRPGALLCEAAVCNSHLVSNLSDGLG